MRIQKSPKKRHRGLVAAGIPVLMVVAIGITGCGPPQPTSGLGAQGKCTQTTTSMPDPNQPGQTINLYQPAGTAATPNMGGTCDDSNRPVVVMVHGLAAGIPAVYADIVTHFVTTGNIVIFATYNTDTTDFVGSYTHEDDAIVVASGQLPRADFSRLGMIGHSMGGGALPFLTQRSASRGWGTSGLWVFLLAPWWADGVGTGQITFPDNARVVVEAYDNDTYVDTNIGIELFHAFTTPYSQKQHVTVRSSSRGFVQLQATHTSPNSIIAPNDAIKFYGIYRIGDALETCALLGTNCDADLSFMGNWTPTEPIKTSLSTDSPVDVGPVPLAECKSPQNPRTATCP